MMKVVRNPSIQMEKFDRPVRNVNCYDNSPRRHSAKGLSKAFDNSIVATEQIYDVIGVEAWQTVKSH